MGAGDQASLMQGVLNIQGRLQRVAGVVKRHTERISNNFKGKAIVGCDGSIQNRMMPLSVSLASVRDIVAKVWYCPRYR